MPHEVESMLARACDLKRVKRKNESPEQREKRLAKQKSQRKSESFEASRKRLAEQRLKGGKWAVISKREKIRYTKI